MRAAPVFIVLNAGSGRDDTERRRAAVQHVLEEADRRYQLFVVDEARQLPPVAQRAVALAQQQQGIVVAAGGDGTISTVAQAVWKSGRPFGVLPQGTFNYFSRTFGIPTDIAEATKVTLHGTVRPVQVGLVNERVFLVNASLGLYPQLLEDREAYKKHFGRSRVVAVGAGIMTLVRGSHHLVLQIEQEASVQVVRTSTLVVGNNVLQLATLGIAEASALQQGQLVAILLRPVGMLARLGVLLRGALGHLGEAESIQSFAFRRLTVRLWRPYGRHRLKVAMDGEVTRLPLPLVFEVAPTPLRLLVPTHTATQGDHA